MASSESALPAPVLNKYSCEMCETSFTRKDNLHKHMRNVHPNEWKETTGIKCETCKKTFPQQRTLNQHTKRTVIQECANCDRKFCNKDSLDRHYRTERPVVADEL